MAWSKAASRVGALQLVLEWYHLHQVELLEDWNLASHRKPLRRIDPLESRA